MPNRFKVTPFHILTLLLATSLTTWTLSIYFNLSMFVTLIPVLMIGFISLISFNFIKEKGNFAILYALGYCVIFYLLFLFINLLAITPLSYTEWLSQFDAMTLEALPYLLTSILVLSTLLMGVLYYFVVVRFRPMVILLIACLPATVALRIGAPTVSYHLFLFMGLFIILYVHYLSYEGEGRDFTPLPCSKSYWSGTLLFLASVLLVAWLIPTPDLNIANPLAELLQKQGNLTHASSYSTSNITNSTSATNTPTEIDDTPIFEVVASEPLYFRTQGFDGYANNTWFIESDYLGRGYSFPDFNEELELKEPVYKLLDFIAYLDEKHLLDDYPELTTLLQYPRSSPTKKEAHITTLNYPIEMYLNPPGMLALSDSSTIYLTELGLCFNDDISKPGANGTYTVTYLNTFPDPNSREMFLLSHLSQGTFIELLDLLDEISTNLLDDMIANEDDRLLDNSTLLEYDSDRIGVAANYRTLPKNISDRTYQLAKELTQNLDSTYEKALAIQDYFYNNGFTYKLDVAPPPADAEAVDYFLFESKEGACVQFATAMTVLCRAAHIPARYMEGFVCTEYDETKGVYTIRQQHAHAFPEVYIPSYGWMIFEPTIPEETQPSSALMDFWTRFDSGNKVLLYILFGLTLLVILASVFILNVCLEKWWRIRIVKKERHYALESIYRRLLKRLKKQGYPIGDYHTPLTTCELLLEKDIDIRWLTHMYNAVHYGNASPDADVIKQALKCYKVLYKKHFKNV